MAHCNIVLALIEKRSQLAKGPVPSAANTFEWGRCVGQACSYDRGNLSVAPIQKKETTGN
jgi:hypothetical protein